MLALDRWFFYLINKSWRSGFLDISMSVSSHLGRPELLFILGLFFILMRKKEARRLGLFLVVGLLFSHIIVSFLKTWIARPRPFAVLSDAHWLVKESGFSFPSGHATYIFMVASLLSTYSKKYRYFYIPAFVVAISRVYLGVHYPSDVVAGALLGMALGYGLGWLGSLSSKRRKGENVC